MRDLTCWSQRELIELVGELEAKLADAEAEIMERNEQED